MTLIAYRRVALTVLLGAVCLLMAHVTHATARRWSVATPAAGVSIRSSNTFRVLAKSTAGDVPIDLYQINLDGSSTKLDTFTATASGSTGAGAYVVSNMAAIFWAYSSLPAATTNAPSVSVTFFNDQPSIYLSQIYYAPPPKLPLAVGDPGLLVNIDLRQGLPAGWSQTGNGTLDAVNGYTPGSSPTSALTNTAIPEMSNTAEIKQGSVIAIFDRSGVAVDNSVGSDFWDSQGDVSTADRQLFTMHSNTGTWGVQASMIGGSTPRFRLRMQTNSMTAPADFIWSTANSHAIPGYQDPKFATLLFTWYQNQYHVFFDGNLVATGALGDVPLRQMFQNICLGNSNLSGTASGAPFGAHAIQQVQLSQRYLGPVLAGPLLGLIPDSFAEVYSVRFEPTATGANGALQVSDVDAAQTALGLYTAVPRRYGVIGQTASFYGIQALLYQTYGFYPPIYNSGHHGHGYSKALGSLLDDAYIAALNIAQPTIVFAGGTVNDVSPFRPADGTLIQDTEDVLNRLVQGGGTRIAAPANPSIEKILYLETLSSQGVASAGGYPEPAYGNESQSVIALTRAQLPSYKPANGVTLTYMKSREWWNESPDYLTYLYGSAPLDRFNAPGGKDYLNPHPDPTGLTVIASHVYETVRDAVMNTPGTDLSIQGTPLTIAGTEETFSVNVSNAGPSNAAGVRVSTVLPAGVMLVGTDSTATCSQIGISLTCTLGSLAAASTATVKVHLTTTGTAPTTLQFAVGDSNGIDSNPDNSKVALAAPPPPPAAPIGLSAAVASTSVNLSWTASSGATSYDVFQGTSAGGEASTAVQSGITTTTATIANLATGSSYYFVVRAVSTAGSSAPSNEASVSIPTPAPPPPPASSKSGGGAMDLNVFALLVGLLMIGKWRRQRGRAGCPSAGS